MADYATLLRDHVTLTCDCVDRFFLQGYVPKLQSVGQVCNFLRWQRDFPIPSSAAFGKIGDAYVKDVHRFAADHDVPAMYFKKGESKEEIARPLIDAAAAEGGEGKVVLIGIAQEKASVWKSWPAKGQEKAPHPHMEWGRQMAFVNHFYFYLWDPEFGPAFIKTNAYAPWPIWIYLLTELELGPPGLVVTVASRDRTGQASGSGDLGCCPTGSVGGDRGSVRAVSPG